MNRQPNQSKITALYERLSEADELKGDSRSIQNQRDILESHARKLGYTNIVHFFDDGITGVRFKRNGWQQLIAEVEAGNVECCIMKKMTRFGRNHIEVGLHMDAQVKHKLKNSELSKAPYSKAPCRRYKGLLIIRLS